jgi:hypothetical protein
MDEIERSYHNRIALKRTVELSRARINYKFKQKEDKAIHLDGTGLGLG